MVYRIQMNMEQDLGFPYQTSNYCTQKRGDGGKKMSVSEEIG